ncbi:hypothetical protein [Dyella acidiphila]|uniref:DUF3592 domain-containing protein n=1 Tax=Dyella acidiphila TaxID=2775866 RepID=A0ABR9GEP9_9GAMM|nr:hypothetical protein [Dyella acidiphila]MBE1162522.1 hypothetical protein [Dyella acidiphila]
MSFRQVLVGIRKRWVGILIWVCASCVLLLFPISIRTVQNARALEDSGQVTIVQADVRQTRILRSFEVQYVFDVGSHTYSREDEFGRTNLWSEVSQADWSAIQNGKTTLAVKYLVKDPRINRPFISGRPGGLRSDIADAYSSVVMSCLLAVIWICCGVGLLRSVIWDRPWTNRSQQAEGSRHEKEFARWGNVRKKGLFRYVLMAGVLAWGMPMFCVMTYLVPHPKLSVLQNAMLWSTAGAGYGLLMWFLQERRYRKGAATRAAAPAQPSPLSENSIWKDY